MTRAVRLLALLSLSRNFAPALGHVNRAAMYGGPPSMQPGVTATHTTTELSTVTVGSSCEVVYVPTTVTVYTECSSPSEVLSVSGLPLSTYSSHGPWINATSAPDAPCTHGLPTSAVLPNSVSSSLGWNHTVSTSRSTLTGTAGTTIETADPIGTSSVRWTNSTRTSAAEKDSTSVITLTVTSSATVTVNATVTSGLNGPTAPSAGFRAGTGLGHNSTRPATSYQPSLTYQTTVPGSSTGLVNGTVATSSIPIRISTGSPSASTTSGMPLNFTFTPSSSTYSHSIVTTETNDALFTNPPSLTLTTGTAAWSNTTMTAAQGWNTTALTSTLAHPTSTASVEERGGDSDGEGGGYGGHSYPAPSPSPSSTTTSGGGTSIGVSSVEAVDPVVGTSSTSTTSGSGIGSHTGSGLTVTSFVTETRSGAGSPSSSAAALPGGGGYGYGGYGYGDGGY